MSGYAVDLLRTATFDNRLGCGDPGARFVDHVVDEKDDPILHVAHEGDGVFQLRVLEAFFFIGNFVGVHVISSASGDCRHERHGHGIIFIDRG